MFKGEEGSGRGKAYSIILYNRGMSKEKRRKKRK
jgi:hypothetical protein